MTAGTSLRPGTISSRRPVPPAIPRPHYVEGAGPADHDDPMVKDADTIARMRVSGRIAAEALAEVGRHVAPGVTTDELDRIGHEFVTSRAPTRPRWATKGSPSRCAHR